MVATSCDLNVPRCTTKGQQVRLHGSREVSSLITEPPGPPWSLAVIKYIIYEIELPAKFYVCSDVPHTHPALGRVVSLQMRWRRGWRGNEDDMKVEDEMKNYPTGTRGGERKRRGRGQTPTPTHLARSGQTLKGQGKRKAEADGHGKRPAEGGKDGNAWTNLPQRNLRLPRHAQDPTYLGREERMK